MPYKVKVLVMSFINNGRYRPGSVIIVDKLDERVELIEEIKPAEESPQPAPVEDFLD